MKKKIWEYENIEKCARFFKRKKIVLVGGCFDLLHFGHHSFLLKAKAQGDILVVALESDEHILHKKHRQPIHTQQERAEILEALYYIDAIILLPYISDDNVYKKLVEIIYPSVIAVSEGDPNKDKKKSHAAFIDAEVKEVISLMPRFATRLIIES